MSAAPIIEARRVMSNGVALLKFFCPHCRRNHHHGAGAKPGDGDGHRVAHCAKAGSPFRESGYVLRERQ